MLRLREVRKDRGLSQASLAALVNLNQGYISDMENGNRSPSLDVLVRLALSLGCTLDELVDMKAHPNAS